MTEHEAKYNELAHALGWDEIKALVPFELERIRAALEASDEHLNGLNLAKWDKAATGQLAPATTCPCCKQRVPPEKPPRHGCGGPLKELFRKARRGHSLAEGVCLLKHVAKVEAKRLP